MMRSDSGWEISAELAGITRQIIENIDLNSKGMPNASSFFLYDRKLRPIIQKMLRKKRTRRRSRWLPKQPRLGARMCQGTFFFSYIFMRKTGKREAKTERKTNEKTIQKAE